MRRATRTADRARASPAGGRTGRRSSPEWRPADGGVEGTKANVPLRVCVDGCGIGIRPPLDADAPLRRLGRTGKRPGRAAGEERGAVGGALLRASRLERNV